MHGKHEPSRLKSGYRQVLGIALVLALLCTMLPAYVFAQDLPAAEDEYLCGHVHDESCGYSVGSEGAPCTHVHDESCYTQALQCPHVCDHVCAHVCGQECYTQVLSCQHVCGEECYTQVWSCQHVCGEECAEGCTHVCDESCYVLEHCCTHVHDESCYVLERQCAHVCDGSCGGLCDHVHDEGCYVPELDCQHVHDESCGYAEPVPGTPCGHVCVITGYEDNTPGLSFATCKARPGAEYQDVCDSLPQILQGSLECAEGLVDIPVLWSCPDYTGEAGTYVFEAEPDRLHCLYGMADDPLTEDLDEGQLPFITVTVAEAELRLTQQTLTDSEGRVAVSGPLPEGAYLEVTEVAIETARELLGATPAAPETETVPERVILFAYDIKIMLPGKTEGSEPTEYQPGAGNPVTVTITPPEPIDAPVEVTHIAEDQVTGETSAQTVATVTPAEDGAVEFAAEGFSIYIGTTSPYTDISVYTELYWSGAKFFTDANCTAGNEVKNSGGTEYTTLPALLSDVNTNATALTIYMTAGYTVANTQTISCTGRSVTLKRYADYTGSLITVSSGGELTLANITIDGNKSNVTASAALVYVSGTLDINSGATLQNNSSTDSGGGVSIADGGSLEMNDGVISGNATTAYGGGVYGYRGTAILSGGRIYGNSAQKGGGVLITGGAALTVSGGSITGNSAVEHGGGIYDDSGSTTTVNSGEISGNTAQTGGGIYNGMSSTLNIYGGKITGNNGIIQAGGLFNGWHLTISGGSIIDNTAPLQANILSNKRDVGTDHVHISGGTFTMDMQSGANAPTTGDGTTLVQCVQCNDASILASTCVTAVSVTYNNNFYDYGCDDMYTDTEGHLYLWLPSGSMVNSVTTYADGTYTVHKLNELTAHAKINYTSLEVPAVLTAALISDSTTANGYQWYRNGTAITGATGGTYTTAVADVGKTVTVVITDTNSNEYTSAGVIIVAPQISVTVPTSSVVTVNAAGVCTVSGGGITNNSAVPVYVTGVSFAWVTDGAMDANELFRDYTAVTAKLTLSGTEYSFQGAAPAARHPTEANGVIAAKVGDLPGSLSLPWAFALGAGNYINLAPAMGEEVLVARITYTVEYQPPSQTP